MSETLKKLEEQRQEQRREALRDLLHQCTESQVAFFNRLYVSVETISDEKIDEAIQLCERTIKKTAGFRPHG